ncbi:MAG: phenylpyruvate tautomerase MIF-related protein [Desulfatibacillaceae bacterium]|nr:phenylpyruvate tautomerase MIF-related protein [Desulfatibacillaceae bacterium]
MPLFKIETNKALGKEEEKTFCLEASRFAAKLLQKSEQVVMVCVETGKTMSFAADEKPTALATIKSVGLPQASCPRYAKEISAFVEEQLAISPARVFVDFFDINPALFGWNGKTLAK